jgi:hypothetical protein
MRGHTLRLDLELAKEGLVLGWHFGARSVAELVRIAVYIQSSVYERGSLRRRPDGYSFRLANPPLRLGAFGRAKLFQDGVAIAPEKASVRLGAEEHERPLASVSRERPLPLLPGVPAEFRVRTDPPPAPGRILSLRLELQNLAIPPLVWMEFRDRVAAGEPPP